MSEALTKRENQRYGLIILGNTGVGKSFLANLCLGKDFFSHKSSPSAVTTTTECKEYTNQGITFVVFNIPGLIEVDQERIDTNKKEIDKAFAECPNAVVMYVFGNQNGRIRNEDVVAFNALNDAYSFESKSLVLVVNGLVRTNLDNTYEGETIVLLKSLIKIEQGCRNVIFLNMVDINKSDDVKELHEKLLQSLMKALPKVHEKQHDIHLEMDQINRLQDKIGKVRDDFDSERHLMMEKFNEAQKQHESDAEAQRKLYELHLEEQKEKIARLGRERSSSQESLESAILLANPFTALAIGIGGLVKGVANVISGITDEK